MKVSIYLIIGAVFFLSLGKKRTISFSNNYMQKIRLVNNGNCSDVSGCCNIDGTNELDIIGSNVKFKSVKLFVQNDSLILKGIVCNPEGYGEDEFGIYRVKREGNSFCYAYSPAIAVTNKKGEFKIIVEKIEKDDYLLFYKHNFFHHIYSLGQLKLEK